MSTTSYEHGVSKKCKICILTSRLVPRSIFLKIRNQVASMGNGYGLVSKVIRKCLAYASILKSRCHFFAVMESPKLCIFFSKKCLRKTVFSRFCQEYEIVCRLLNLDGKQLQGPWIGCIQFFANVSQFKKIGQKPPKLTLCIFVEKIFFHTQRIKTTYSCPGYMG